MDKQHYYGDGVVTGHGTIGGRKVMILSFFFIVNS